MTTGQGYIYGASIFTMYPATFVGSIILLSSINNVVEILTNRFNNAFPRHRSAN